jgi:BASS family bile acid:Na+ symporter
MDFNKTISKITNAFPFIVLVASVISFYYPKLFTWFSGNLITYGLGVIMLGMGLTLTLEDFKGVMKYPKLVFLGLILQYTIMPYSGWFCAEVFKLETPLAVGLILVACCPGGTASNVITYLARGNVVLSVTMTSISTLIAIILTPALTLLFTGNRIEVNAIGLFTSTLQVVIFPIVLGLVMNRFLPGITRKIIPVMPLTSILFICLIVASIIGAGRDQIIHSGWKLIAAVFSLHTLGFIFGYVFSKLLSKDEIASRTISIEVGMQNSGLGVVLARANFANPLVATPSAISSLFHSLIASLLAAIWRKSADKYN